MNLKIYSIDEVNKIIEKMAVIAWSVGMKLHNKEFDSRSVGSKIANSIRGHKLVEKKLYKLFTDGASRGNPGDAGAGSVIMDSAGEVLIEDYTYLGQCTNNVAEYKALLLGVRSALKLGCGRLEIFLDSQLIVRQLQGQYKVKNAALKPLFAEVKGLLSQLEYWSVNHIPREKNKRADSLANKGIDELKYK